MAIRQNVSVIDATRTLLAFHQTGVDGNKAGHKRSGADYNLKVIKKAYGKFNYRMGWTTKAAYETEKDMFGNVFIQKRPPQPTSNPPVAVVKPGAKPPQKTVAKIPQKSVAKVPVKIVADVPVKIVAKAPEKIVAKTSEKIVAKPPEKIVPVKIVAKLPKKNVETQLKPTPKTKS